MNFFDMNFSTLFCKKHGKTIYKSICKKIKFKVPSMYNEQYIEIIFSIAFLDFFGMTNIQISNFIKDNRKIKNIDISNLKKLHNTTIKEIQKYIQIANSSTFYEKNSR